MQQDAFIAGAGILITYELQGRRQRADEPFDLVLDLAALEAKGHDQVALARAVGATETSLKQFMGTR